MSADGRYVVLASSSGTWVPGVVDTNDTHDVFLWDRETTTVTLVSHAAGAPLKAGANGYSYPEAISANGRYVAFFSYASDLIAGGNGCLTCGQTYIWDRDTGTVSLVSHLPGLPATAGDGQSNTTALSADGRYVAFVSAASNLISGAPHPNGRNDVFLLDRDTDTVSLVSHQAGLPTTPANGESYLRALSADGRYLAFFSNATNLIVGGGCFACGQVYLWDRDLGTVALVSHVWNSATTAGNGYAEPTAFSGDGRYLTFVSGAANLIEGGIDGNGGGDAFVWARETDAVTLVSHAPSSATTAATGVSRPIAVSADGSWVAFSSDASDLVAGATDLDGTTDAYLWDGAQGVVTLVSHSAISPATAGNGYSTPLAISADGRYVLFDSESTDLVAGGTDSNGAGDAFVWDRDNGATALVSHQVGIPTAAAGGESYSNAFSADGRYVAFRSTATDLIAGGADTNEISDAFHWDRDSSSVTLVSRASILSMPPGNSRSAPRAINADGRYVAFWSQSSNLVAVGSEPSTTDNAFFWDRETGTVTLVSHAAGSTATPGNGNSDVKAISADGRYVAFRSAATDLIAGGTEGNLTDDAFLWERDTGAVTLLSHSSSSATTTGNSYSDPAAISADGRYVVFLSRASNLIAGSSDDNDASDVFVWDRQTGSTTLVSRASASATSAANGSSSPLAISADGRYVAFHSTSRDLLAAGNGCLSCGQGYLWDRDSGGVLLITHKTGEPNTAGNNTAWIQALSADGRHVTFWYLLPDLIAGGNDTNGVEDAFHWDRDTGTVSLISHRPEAPATSGNERSFPTAISADGRYVTFQSAASDLIAGGSDTNGTVDAFLWDRDTGAVLLMSHAAGSPLTAGAGGYSSPTGISADGRLVPIYSESSDLVAGGISPLLRGQAYVFDRNGSSMTLVSHAMGLPTTAGNGSAYPDAISANGAYVTFASHATNLMAVDTNRESQAYLWSEGEGTLYSIAPCRRWDTRQNDTPLQSGTVALLQITGDCGIPSTAGAVAVNITVISPSGDGQLTMYRGDGTAPNASVISFSANQTRANNAVLELSINGDGKLAVLPAIANNGSVHVVIDVTGYFE